MRRSAAIMVGLAALVGAAPALAQSLSVEELRAQIDARMNALNPYQELLDDPDPGRSMAAMEIMIESGDPVLVDMATEFGLLSSSAAVRRRALESFLATKPSLTLRLDGSVTESTDFARHMKGSWRGTVDADRTAYTTWKVGAYDDRQGCYVFEGYSSCFLRISAEGVAVSGSNLNGQLSNDGSGELTGAVTLTGVAEPIPTTISLID